MDEVLHARGGPRDAALVLLRSALRPGQPRLRSAGLPQRRPAPARRRLSRPPAPRPRDRHLGAVRGAAAHRLHRPHLADRPRHGAGDERRLRASGTPRSPTPRRVRPASCRRGCAPTPPAAPRCTASWPSTSTGPGWCRSPAAGGLPIRTAGASLHVARLAPGEAVALPDAPLLHVFAATGAVELGSEPGDARLLEGDAVRLTDEPGRGRRPRPTTPSCWSGPSLT